MWESFICLLEKIVLTHASNLSIKSASEWVCLIIKIILLPIKFISVVNNCLRLHRISLCTKSCATHQWNKKHRTCVSRRINRTVWWVHKTRLTHWLKIRYYWLCLNNISKTAWSLLLSKSDIEQEIRLICVKVSMWIGELPTSF